MSRPLDTVPLHNADLSFDDLQYSGVVASRRLHCRECNSIQNMSERENRYYCLTCAAPYQQSENNNSNNNNSNGGDENNIFRSMFASTIQEYMGSNPAFVGNNNFLDLVNAQRDVNIDELMNNMLSHSTGTPTQQKFLDLLIANKLTQKDFIHPVIRVNGLDRDVFPTQAMFGKSIIDLHKTDGASSQVHFEAQLIPANPFDAKNISSFDFSSNIMYSFRGVISFVDKARAAQSHGASALIVSNNESSWPYNMTDSNKTGGDIKIPCFMICQKDAELLTITLRKNKENANKSTETSSSSSSNSSSSSSSSSISSSPFSSSSSSASSSSSSSHLAIKLCTRDRKLACPICMSDFELDMEAVKLPCTHFYCHSCIVPWLKKRNTCPLCRYVLPTDSKPNPIADSHPDSNNSQLHSAMFT